MQLNEKGQSILEYIIITSLIGVFSLMTMKQFGEVLKTRIEHMKQKITQNITIQ